MSESSKNDDNLIELDDAGNFLERRNTDRCLSELQIWKLCTGALEMTKKLEKQLQECPACAERLKEAQEAQKSAAEEALPAAIRAAIAPKATALEYEQSKNPRPKPRRAEKCFGSAGPSRQEEL